MRKAICTRTCYRPVHLGADASKRFEPGDFYNLAKNEPVPSFFEEWTEQDELEKSRLEKEAMESKEKGLANFKEAQARSIAEMPGPVKRVIERNADAETKNKLKRERAFAEIKPKVVIPHPGLKSRKEK